MAAAVACVTIVVATASVQSQDDPVESFRRQREAFAKRFDLAKEHRRLAGFVRTLSRALGGPAAFRQPTISTIPTSSSDRDRLLQAAAVLVAQRFNLAPDGVTARFGSVARPHAGRIVMRGQTAAIEVADRHRGNDDLVVAVVAHEFAHAALERGLAGTGDEHLADDECLVDAAAVMVGLGPIMLRASFYEQITGTGRRQRWEVLRIGELDPVAIAYLTLAQAELAGVDDDTRRVFVARWMEPAWSFRRGQWDRAVPRHRPGQASAIVCPTCLSDAIVTADRVTYGCPVCGVHARVEEGRR